MHVMHVEDTNWLLLNPHEQRLNLSHSTMMVLFSVSCQDDFQQSGDLYVSLVDWCVWSESEIKHFKTYLGEWRTTKTRTDARCKWQRKEHDGVSLVIDCMLENIKTQVVLLTYWTWKQWQLTDTIDSQYVLKKAAQREELV